METNISLELIDREIDGDVVKTVNAKELFSVLEIKRDFSNWIKIQIKRSRLKENRDYLTYAQKGTSGKFDSIDYHLSIADLPGMAMKSG